MRQKTLYNRIQFILAWLLAGLLEIPAAAVIYGNELIVPLMATAFLHLGSCVIMFWAYPKEGGWFLKSRHWGLVSTLSCLLFPVWGWILMTFLYIRSILFKKPVSSLKWEDEPDQNPKAVFKEERTEGGVARIHKEGDILSAVDILMGKDPAKKRGALSVLARLRTPEAIHWIQKARTDPHADVRFYASSTLTSLQREFEESLNAAQEQCLNSPANRDLQIQRFRLTYEFAISGLVEADQKREMLRQCQTQLDRLAGQDLIALELLFRMEKELDLELALNRLNRIIKIDSQNQEKWIKERIILLFQLSRYAEVCQQMSCLKNTEDMEWNSAKFWWSYGKS